MMKIAQRRYRDAWRADRRHAGADDRIQHPRGDRRDHARHRLDVNDPTHPTEAGRYGAPSTAMDVAVAGRYAYVALTPAQTLGSCPTEPS